MALVVLCAFVALVALLYFRAERGTASYLNALDTFEDPEYADDLYSELYFCSGPYMLTANATRITDVETGGSFPATSDEVAEIKRISRLTCSKCNKVSCEFRGDPYNTNGDCLADK
jgi:hypothetical protein